MERELDDIKRNHLNKNLALNLKSTKNIKSEKTFFVDVPKKRINTENEDIDNNKTKLITNLRKENEKLKKIIINYELSNQTTFRKINKISKNSNKFNKLKKDLYSFHNISKSNKKIKKSSCGHESLINLSHSNYNNLNCNHTNFVSSSCFAPTINKNDNKKIGRAHV